MAKQDTESKKRELSKKIEKYVNQLPPWDLLKIYLYISCARFREKSSVLAWNWLLFQMTMHDGWEPSSKAERTFQVDKSTVLLRTGSWAFFVGGLLALYISLSTLLQMPFHLWLTFHGFLFVISILLGVFIGYYSRLFGFSFRWMLVSIAIFFSVLMILYISSYVVTTTLLADRMVWIPYFYHDYNYHGFSSVTEYLNYENNYSKLLHLQVFSLSVSSVMYFVAGGVGYGIKMVMGRGQESAGMTPSGN